MHTPPLKRKAADGDGDGGVLEGAEGRRPPAAPRKAKADLRAYFNVRKRSAEASVQPKKLEALFRSVVATEAVEEAEAEGGPATPEGTRWQPSREPRRDSAERIGRWATLKMSDSDSDSNEDEDRPAAQYPRHTGNRPLTLRELKLRSASRAVASSRAAQSATENRTLLAPVTTDDRRGQAVRAGRQQGSVIDPPAVVMVDLTSDDGTESVVVDLTSDDGTESVVVDLTQGEAADGIVSC
jgi:hypothetical protein